MPGTVRRLSAINQIHSLINKTTFAIAFTGIALSLFFFAPGRMMSIRISVLSACCIVLLVAAGTFGKRAKRSIRLPLTILGIAGVCFFIWGVIVTSGNIAVSDGNIQSLLSGMQFVLFGAVTFFTTMFAKK